MKTFPLRIGTPDGLLFEGEVERIVCRSITGDLAVLAGHCNFCTALGMGKPMLCWRMVQDGKPPVSGDAFHDERNLPPAGDYLGVAGRH